MSEILDKLEEWLTNPIVVHIKGEVLLLKDIKISFEDEEGNAVELEVEEGDLVLGPVKVVQ